MNGVPAGGATGGGSREVALSGWFRLTLGLLAMIVGALWTVQGLGYVEGSVLTDQRLGAAIGAGLVLVGVALIWLGVRARGRR
nr:hypothetical protein [Micromonospora endophytica]